MENPGWRAIVALMVCLVVGRASPVSAAPVDVQRDRTDNGFSFSYDAAQGEITDAASSIRIDRTDPVSFVINIRENPNSDEVGRRLRARMSVALNKGHGARRYEGNFWFEIVDGAGTVVYSAARPRELVLRPKPQRRSDVMRFNFDLPSGSYSAAGFFERTAG